MFDLGKKSCLAKGQTIFASDTSDNRNSERKYHLQPILKGLINATILTQITWTNYTSEQTKHSNCYGSLKLNHIVVNPIIYKPFRLASISIKHIEKKKKKKKQSIQ